MLLNLSEGSDSPFVPSTVAERECTVATLLRPRTPRRGVQVVQYDKIISKCSESLNTLSQMICYFRKKKNLYEESNDTWRVHGGNTFLPHTPRRGVRDS